MLADERLPQQHAHCPHIARGSGVATSKPLGRDVRERSGHIADGRQGVGLVELGQAEVEQPDRDRRRHLDEDVRWLHVAVDDPDPVGVCERVQDLGRGLDRVTVAELPAAERLTQRAALHVLVRDIDVAAVAAEVVGANAALVAKP